MLLFLLPLLLPVNTYHLPTYDIIYLLIGIIKDDLRTSRSKMYPIKAEIFALLVQQCIPSAWEHSGHSVDIC